MKRKTHKGLQKRVNVKSSGTMVVKKSCKNHLLSNKSKRQKKSCRGGMAIHKTKISAVRQLLN